MALCVNMNHEQVEKELSFLIGREVSFRRIAGNTIILYFGGEPGDDAVTTLRIDPSWRYFNLGKWLLGSGDLPWEKDENESEDEFSTRFNEICDVCAPLVHSIVESVSLAPNSSDIEINFSGNQRLVSFAGYTDEEGWVYTNRLKNKKIYGLLNSYETEGT